jgi:hypothetical protein
LFPAELPSNNIAVHAKLWVFAECYDVIALKQLALFKLHRDLCVLQLGPGNATAFIDTVEFVYSNTAVVGNKEDVRQIKNDLREVVLAYAVCYADTLVDNEYFLALLKVGGDLAADFAQGVTKRIN